MKKILSLCLCILMLSISSLTAFANSNDLANLKEYGIDIEFISYNQVKIIDNDITSIITVIKDNPTMKEVLIEDSEGNSTLLTTNKIKGTITSSSTNQKININEFNTYYKSLKSSPSYGDTTYEKISFAKIKRIVGVASSIVAVAGLIVSCFTGGTAAIIGKWLTKIGGAIGILDLINNGDPNSGIRVDYKYVKRTVYKQGSKWTFGEWEITNMSIY